MTRWTEGPGRLARRSCRFLVATSTVLGLCTGSGATKERHTIAAHIGLFDVDTEKRKFEGGVEYHALDLGRGLRPMGGVSATTEGSVYAYGGFRWEIDELSWLEIAPSLAVSVYDKGHGKDLGQALEFRSGLDVRYRFDDGFAVGIGWYHLSNASMNEHNPGSNSILMTNSYGF